jgi:hypothetical protein
MSFPDGGYSSHLEALVWAFQRTTGPVIEYGGGWYSTPVLHGLCEATSRELYTVEYEPSFANQLAQGWQNEWHRVGILEVPDFAGLVLVDGSAESRAPALRDSHNAQIVVVHDTEPESVVSYPGMHDAMNRYRYRRDWTTFPWHTSALSDTIEL